MALDYQTLMGSSIDPINQQVEGNLQNPAIKNQYDSDKAILENMENIGRTKSDLDPFFESVDLSQVGKSSRGSGFVGEFYDETARDNEDYLSESYITPNLLPKLDQVLYENQGTIKAIANGLTSRTLSVVPKIGNTLASALGLVGGIGNMAFNAIDAAIGDAEFDPDKAFSIAYDNALVNSMNEADEYLKKAFPVFGGDKYANENILSRMSTAKFWAEDIADGVAFTTSSMLTGAGVTGGLSKLGLLAKGSGAISTTAATIVNTNGEAMLEANEAFKTIMQQKDKFMESKLMKDTDVHNMVSIYDTQIKELLDKRFTTNPEELNLLNSQIDKLMSDRESYLKDTEKRYSDEFESLAAEAARMTYLGNVAILTGPNYIQSKLFNRLLSRNADDVSKTLLKGIKDGTMKPSDISVTKEVLKGMGTQALTEGFWEENAQTALSTYLDERAFKKMTLGDDDVNMIADFANTIAGTGEKMLSNVWGLTGDTEFGNFEGAMSIITGALSSAIFGAAGNYKQARKDIEIAKFVEGKFQGINTLIGESANAYRDNVKGLLVEYGKDEQGNPIYEEIDNNGVVTKPLMVDFNKAAQILTHKMNEDRLLNSSALATIEDNNLQNDMLINEELASTVYGLAATSMSTGVLTLDEVKEKFADALNIADPQDGTNNSFDQEVVQQRIDKANQLFDLYDNLTKSIEIETIGYEKKPAFATISNLMLKSAFYANNMIDTLKNVEKNLENQTTETTEQVEKKAKALEDIQGMISDYQSIADAFNTKDGIKKAYDSIENDLFEFINLEKEKLSLLNKKDKTEDEQKRLAYLDYHLEESEAIYGRDAVTVENGIHKYNSHLNLQLSPTEILNANQMTERQKTFFKLGQAITNRKLMLDHISENNIDRMNELFESNRINIVDEDFFEMLSSEDTDALSDLDNFLNNAVNTLANKESLIDLSQDDLVSMKTLLDKLPDLSELTSDPTRPVTQNIIDNYTELQELLSGKKPIGNKKLINDLKTNPYGVIKYNLFTAPIDQALALKNQFESNPSEFDDIARIEGLLKDISKRLNIISEYDSNLLAGPKSFSKITNELQELNKFLEDAKEKVLSNLENKSKQDELLERAINEDLANTFEETDLTNAIDSIIKQTNPKNSLSELVKQITEKGSVFYEIIIKYIKNGSVESVSDLIKTINISNEAARSSIRYNTNQLSFYKTAYNEVFLKRNQNVVENLYKFNALRNLNPFFNLILGISNNDNPIRRYLDHGDLNKLETELAMISDVERKVIKVSDEDFVNIQNIVHNFNSLRRNTNLLNDINSDYDYSKVIAEEVSIATDKTSKYAPTRDQRNKIHHIIKWFSRPFTELNHNFSSLDDVLNGSLMIKGFAGTGKSVFVAPHAVKILSKLGKLNMNNVAIMSINDTLVDSLVSNIGLKDKGELNETTELLIFDEFAYLNHGSITEFVKRLNEVNEARQAKGLSKVKVLLLGDTNQISKDPINTKKYLEKTSLDMIVEESGPKITQTTSNIEVVPTLTISYRSNVGVINSSANQFKGSTSMDIKAVAQASGDMLLDKSPKGIHTATSLQEIANQIKFLISENPNMKFTLIYPYKTDISESAEEINIANKFVNDNNLSDNVEIKSPEEVQGRTIDNIIYLNSNFETSDSFIARDYNTEMYTVLSRASNYALILDSRDNPRFNQLSSNPAIAKTTAINKDNIEKNKKEYTSKVIEDKSTYNSEFTKKTPIIKEEVVEEEEVEEEIIEEPEVIVEEPIIKIAPETTTIETKSKESSLYESVETEEELDYDEEDVVDSEDKSNVDYDFIEPKQEVSFERKFASEEMKKEISKKVEQIKQDFTEKRKKLKEDLVEIGKEISKIIVDKESIKKEASEIDKQMFDINSEKATILNEISKLKKQQDDLLNVDEKNVLNEDYLKLSKEIIDLNEKLQSVLNKSSEMYATRTANSTKSMKANDNYSEATSKQNEIRRELAELDVFENLEIGKANNLLSVDEMIVEYPRSKGFKDILPDGATKIALYQTSKDGNPIKLVGVFAENEDGNFTLVGTLSKEQVEELDLTDRFNELADNEFLSPVLKETDFSLDRSTIDKTQFDIPVTINKANSFKINYDDKIRDRFLDVFDNVIRSLKLENPRFKLHIYKRSELKNMPEAVKAGMIYLELESDNMPVIRLQMNPKFIRESGKKFAFSDKTGLVAYDNSQEVIEFLDAVKEFETDGFKLGMPIFREVFIKLSQNIVDVSNGSLEFLETSRRDNLNSDLLSEDQLINMLDRYDSDSEFRRNVQTIVKATNSVKESNININLYDSRDTYGMSETYDHFVNKIKNSITDSIKKAIVNNKLDMNMFKTILASEENFNIPISQMNNLFQNINSLNHVSLNSLIESGNFERAIDYILAGHATRMRHADKALSDNIISKDQVDGFKNLLDIVRVLSKDNSTAILGEKDGTEYGFFYEESGKKKGFVLKEFDGDNYSPVKTYRLSSANSPIRRTLSNYIRSNQSESKGFRPFIRQSKIDGRNITQIADPLNGSQSDYDNGTAVTSEVIDRLMYGDSYNNLDRVSVNRVFETAIDSNTALNEEQQQLFDQLTTKVSGASPTSLIIGFEKAIKTPTGEIIADESTPIVEEIKEADEITALITPSDDIFDISNDDLFGNSINNIEIDDFFDDDTPASQLKSIDESLEKDKIYGIDKVKELFYKYNTDLDQKELADRVFKIADKLDLKITFLNTDLGFNIGGRADGDFVKYAKLTTLLRNKDRVSNILLHEIIHSVTVTYIDAYKNKELTNHNLIKAVENIKEVYSLVKENSSLRNEYGLKNEKELIAEIANPSFRVKLRKINLWDRLKQAIKQLFFFEDSKSVNAEFILNKALDDILDNFDYKLFDEYSRTKITDESAWDFYKFNEEIKLSEQESINYLKRMFPQADEHLFKFFDKLNSLKTNKPVWGRFVNGAIHLLRNDNNTVYKTTVKHEAFHKIFREYLAPKHKTTLFKAYLSTLSQQDIERLSAMSIADRMEFVEEGLAEMFAQREEKPIQNKVLRYIHNMFRKMLLTFFSDGQRKLNSYFDLIDNFAFSKQIAPSFSTADRKNNILKYFGDTKTYQQVEQYVLSKYKMLYEKGDIRPDVKGASMSEGEINTIIMSVMANEKLQYQKVVKALNQLKDMHQDQIVNGKPVSEFVKHYEKLLDSMKTISPILDILEKTGTNKKMYEEILKNLYPQSKVFLFAESKGVYSIEEDNQIQQDIEDENNSDELDTTEDPSNEIMDEAEEQISQKVEGSFEQNSDSHNAMDKIFAKVKRFTDSISYEGKLVPRRAAFKIMADFVRGLNSNTSDSKTTVTNFNNQLKVLLKAENSNLTWNELIKQGKEIGAVVKAFVDIYEAANAISIDGITVPKNLDARSHNRVIEIVINNKPIERHNMDNRTYYELVRNTIINDETFKPFLNALGVDNLQNFLSKLSMREQHRNDFIELFSTFSTLKESEFIYDEFVEDFGNVSMKVFNAASSDKSYIVRTNMKASMTRKLNSPEAITKTVDKFKTLFESFPSNYDNLSIEQRETIAMPIFNEFKKYFGIHMGSVGVYSEHSKTYDYAVRSIKYLMVDHLNTAYEKALKAIDSDTQEQVDIFYLVTNLLNDEGSNLDNITTALSGLAVNKFNTSVKDASGKKRYAIATDSNGYKAIVGLINRLKGIKTFLPSYLNKDNNQTNFFKQNPLIASKKYLSRYLTHNAITTKNGYSKDTLVSFTDEDFNKMFERMFGAQFLDMIASAGERDVQYYQNVYIKSNRPDTNAGLMKVLGKKDLDYFFEQQFEQILSQNFEQDGKLKGYKLNNFTGASVLKNALKANLTTEEFDSLFKDVDKARSLFNTNKQEILNNIYEQLDKDAQQIAESFILNQARLPQNFRKSIDNALNHDLISEKEHSDMIQALDNAEFGDRINQSKKNVIKNTTEMFLPMMKLFAYNHAVNGYFLTQIAAGNFNYYGDSIALVKRLSLVYAPGTAPTINDNFGLKEKSKILIVDDVTFSKESSVNFMKGVVEGISNEDLSIIAKQMLRNKQIDQDLYDTFERTPDATRAKIVEIVTNKYGGKPVDLADAQGFITPERHTALVKGYGDSYNLGNIGKPSWFDIKPDGTPTAVKYSWVVLTDEMCARSEELSKARDFMRKHGAEELAFSSAVKVGLPAVKINGEQALITWDDIQGNVDDRVNHSIIEMQNQNYRMQLNPMHGAETNAVTNPSQLTYFLNILEDNTKQADVVYNALEKLYKQGASIVNNKVLNKNGSLNKQNLINLVKAKFENSDVDSPLGVALEEGISMNMPLIADKALRQISSVYNKNTVSVKFNGGKFVLQSALGHKNHKGQDLEYRRINGRMVAECLISKGTLYNMYGKKIADQMIERINNGDDTPMFKNGDSMGFRIPSSEIHSGISLKIVGFYDNSSDNGIIVPARVVQLHGSDFDVDSLFTLFRHNPDKFYAYDEANKRYYLKNYSQTAIEQFSKKDYEDYYKNVIIEEMLDVFSNDVNVIRMFSPISMDNIGDIRAEIMKELGDTKGKETDLSRLGDYFDTHQSSFNGAAGTGIFANGVKALAYMIRSGKTEDGKITVPSINFSKLSKHVIKVNGVELNQLSNVADTYEILDSLLNAAIDNVKEQLLPYFGLSGNTIPAFISMLSSADKDGNPMSPEYAFRFIKQPVIDMISKQKGSREAGVKLANNVLLDLNQKIHGTIDATNFLKEDHLALLDNIYPDGLSTELMRDGLVNGKKYVDLRELLNKDSLTKEDIDLINLQTRVYADFLAFRELGNQLSVIASFCNITRNMPSSREDIENFRNKLNKIVTKVDGVEQINPDLAYVIPGFFETNPHIEQAVETFKSLESVTEKAIVKHNPKFKGIFKEVGKLARLGKSQEEDFKLRNAFMEFLISGVEWEPSFSYENLPEQKFSFKYLNKRKDLGPQQKSGVLTHKEAFAKLFGERLIELKNYLQQRNISNGFLEQILINMNNRGTYEIQMPNATNMDNIDMINMQSEFEKLFEYEVDYISGDGLNNVYEVRRSNSLEYSQLMKDFVRYGVNEFGLNFGAMNFSKVLPHRLYKPVSDKFQELLDKIESKSEEELSNIAEDFALQYAMVNPAAFSTIKDSNYKTIYPIKDGSGVTNDIWHDYTYEILSDEDGKPTIELPTINIIKGTDWSTITRLVGYEDNKARYRIEGYQTKNKSYNFNIDNLEYKSKSIDYSKLKLILLPNISKEDLSKGEFTLPTRKELIVPEGFRVLISEYSDITRRNAKVFNVINLTENSITLSDKNISKLDNNSSLGIEDSNIDETLNQCK